MKPGDFCRLVEDTVPWYSGYGMNRSVVLPKGLLGTVQAVHVPSPTRNNYYYNVARFEYEGESWQTEENWKVV